MTKKVHKLTLATAVSVSAQSTMLLTARQAEARRHLLLPTKGWHKDAKDERRLPFNATNPVLFKAGEEIWIEGEPDRAVALAAQLEAAAKPAAERDDNGDTPDMAQLRKQFDAAYGQLREKLTTARTDARQELLAEIEQRNAVFEAADNAADATDAATAKLAAEQDPERRKPLQKALDDALEAQAKADKLVNDLPELKA